MALLKYNNTLLKYNNNLLKFTGETPEPPSGDGYWTNYSTGEDTPITMSDASITGTTFNTPSWAANAAAIVLPEGVTTTSNAIQNFPELRLLSFPSTMVSTGGDFLNNVPKIKGLILNGTNIVTINSIGSNLPTTLSSIRASSSVIPTYQSAPIWTNFSFLFLPPITNNGYWIHKTTDVSTPFGNLDIGIIRESVSGGEWLLQRNVWYYDAKEVKLPDGLNALGGYVFEGCISLTKVIFPESGFYALRAASLSNTRVDNTLSLPNTLQIMEPWCLSDIPTLTNLTLPSTVNNLGEGFINSSGITQLTSLATTPPTAAENSFSGTDSLTSIKVPSGSLSAYQSAAGWSSKSGIISAI